MATFTKRGDLQWQAKIRRKGYPQQSKTFDTRADAEKWARAVEHEMDRGRFVSSAEAENTSFTEALDRYEREIASNKRGATQERSIIRMLRDSWLAKRSLAGVRRADIAKLRDEWCETHSPATVVRRLAVISHLFTIARKEWGLESLSNPVELVRKPTVKNERTRRIISIESASHRGASTDELAYVKAASESAFLPMLIDIAVETAMRRGELITLGPSQVDLKKRVAGLAMTKNGSAREVPLSRKAVAIFEKLFEEQRDVFFPLRADAVTRAFERAVARARKSYEEDCADKNVDADPNFLVDLCFHDLRHEATSRLASIFPLHELAKITGHRDTKMLMRYYHPRAEDLAKKLD
ncbi:tyrosine-type recombinase/integrase [Burkholderia ubonensis]|uniref:tyrosine-type recombinase/integrase n=1 Tax=Burkholderia ubonensis TaxID=101571 RepID=UPI000755AAA1|nr:site-specific integrase [Burkholderia ubonensis]AOI69150.1 DNA recombinase [Burkholderia ubonensis]KUZ13777.1 DNA recombinase [Burkholderia ubonensis]KUZ29680.1 DNA recombinase [Burkholderia ubonensis]KUZ30889.1 DNA recombinase [Burkholderia ubonensis]KUZ46199.1 DNA recombinase [Burkholderia ubonensis]